jgi:hypothetical protein
VEKQHAMLGMPVLIVERSHSAQVNGIRPRGFADTKAVRLVRGSQSAEPILRSLSRYLTIG